MQQQSAIVAISAVAALAIFFAAFGFVQPAHAQCQPCQQALQNPQTLVQASAPQQAQIIKNLTTTETTTILTSLQPVQQQAVVSNLANTDPQAAVTALGCLPKTDQAQVLQAIPVQSQASIITALPQQQQQQVITGIISQGGTSCPPTSEGGSSIIQATPGTINGGVTTGGIISAIQPVLPSVVLGVHHFGFGGFFDHGFGGFHHFR